MRARNRFAQPTLPVPTDRVTRVVRRLRKRNLLLAALLLICLFLAIWGRIMPSAISLQVGDRSDRTILASRSGAYTDTERTERLRQLAQQAVPQQFRSEPSAIRLAAQAANDFFDAAAQVQGDPALANLPARIDALQASLEFRVNDETLRLALVTPPGALQRVRQGTLQLVEQAEALSIRGSTDDLPVARAAVTTAADNLNFTPAYTAMAADVARAVLVPNLVFDPLTTQTEKDKAAASVKPVVQPVRAGEIVIATGETITQRHLDELRALGLMNAPVKYPQGLAMLFILTLLGYCLFFFTSRACPEAYYHFPRLAVICAIVALVALVLRLGQASMYLEAFAITAVAGGAMLVALISCADVGLVVAAISALLFGLIIPDPGIKPMVTLFLCGGFAAYLVNLSSTRTGSFVLTALAIAVFDGALLLVNTEAFGQEQSWPLIGATVVGGVLSSVLAIGIMIALDRPLDLLTDLRLAELASPHQPLQGRLLREAPGSYQASVMVANYAEQAAESIGLSGLFVRTAALYHDVGKLKRPYFFVENQFGGENPHTKLSPYISALIISSHPRDGAEMGREAGLPKRIVDIIEQHQGTDLIRYFYEKAVEQAPEGTTVPETSFRYPGPKPQTKEAAVIMLSDAVEAAVRTLDEPSPANVTHMVHRIVQSRVNEGQLDDCPLTFAELSTVRETLVASINSAFHRRIKYPEQIPAEARLLAERLSPEQQSEGLLEAVREEEAAQPHEPS
ncbi:MAG TPA: HDIG domain-containing protein [Armatimonadota bacterium]|jgi:hypothetical protein